MILMIRRLWVQTPLGAIFDKKDTKNDDVPILPSDDSSPEVDISDVPSTPKVTLKVKSEESLDTSKDNVITCKLITRTVWLKKRDKNLSGRKYKCPSCSSIHNSVSELNSHYKASHPPVKCKKCGLHFNTPSTLSRHSYQHTKTDYPCTHCEKCFPFDSDLKLHLNTHQKIKSFRCKSSGCTKSYFSKVEVTKHAETHTKILWTCELCLYINKDKRNLKAHIRVHSNLKPYMCKACLELFRYDTQLLQHLPCKVNLDSKDIQTENPKRSSSPTF